MKKTAILIAVLVVLFPVLAFSDMMTVRLGYYMPNALSDSYISSHPYSLIGTEFSQMSLRQSDFRGSILGGGYEFFLNPYLSAALSVDYFSHENGGYYLDYVGLSFQEGDFAAPYNLYRTNYDFDIRHSFHISMTPIQRDRSLFPSRPDFRRHCRLLPGIYLYGSGSRGYYGLSHHLLKRQ
jgi:hypothetical protein